MGLSVRTWQTVRCITSTVVVQNVLLAILACAFASCATFDVTTKQAAGAPRFPPSDPARVEILGTEPQRAYERLGYIVVDAPTDQVPSSEEVAAKVRSEAGKLGADAVVVVQPKPAYVFGIRWDGIVETVKDRKLTVVAIKYRP